MVKGYKGDSEKKAKNFHTMAAEWGIFHETKNGI
jgi:hypothetical protein